MQKKFSSRASPRLAKTRLATAIILSLSPALLPGFRVPLPPHTLLATEGAPGRQRPSRLGMLDSPLVSRFVSLMQGSPTCGLRRPIGGLFATRRCQRSRDCCGHSGLRSLERRGIPAEGRGDSRPSSYERWGPGANVTGALGPPCRSPLKPGGFQLPGFPSWPGNSGSRCPPGFKGAKVEKHRAS